MPQFLNCAVEQRRVQMGNALPRLLQSQIGLTDQRGDQHPFFGLVATPSREYLQGLPQVEFSLGYSHFSFVHLAEYCMGGLGRAMSAFHPLRTFKVNWRDTRPER